MCQPEHPTFGSEYGRSLVVGPASRALLLCEGKLSPDERNLTALLDFFGIPWKAVGPCDMTRECASTESDRFQGFCILSSAPRMAAVLQTIEGRDAGLPAWMLSASSVYVYGFQDTTPCRMLLRFLAGAADAEIRKPIAREARVSVTRDFP